MVVEHSPTQMVLLNVVQTIVISHTHSLHYSQQVGEHMHKRVFNRMCSTHASHMSIDPLQLIVLSAVLVDNCTHHLVIRLNAGVNHYWVAIPSSLWGCRKMRHNYKKIGIHKGSWNSRKWRYMHGLKLWPTVTHIFMLECRMYLCLHQVHSPTELLGLLFRALTGRRGNVESIAAKKDLLTKWNSLLASIHS